MVMSMAELYMFVFLLALLCFELAVAVVHPTTSPILRV